MKTTKRFLSIMIIAIMTFCLGAFNVSALEDGGSEDAYSETIKLNDSTGAAYGQTFTAYKVFDLSHGGDAYTYTPGSDCLSSEEYEFDGEKYTQDTITSSNVNDFAKGLYSIISTGNLNGVRTFQTKSAMNKTAEIEITEKGYYAIFRDTALTKDSETPLRATDNANSFIALISCPNKENVYEIGLKLGLPTLDKKIWHNDENSWQIVGDNQIGDVVNFRLETTVQDNMKYFDNYEYIIHDNLDPAFTFNLNSADIHVYVDGTDVSGLTNVGGRELELNKDYTVNSDNINCNQCDLHVKIDYNAIKDLSSDVKIYTYYKATLTGEPINIYTGDENDKANQNVAWLEYSNDPHVSTNHGKTPEKIVDDWTFTAMIKKVDGGNGKNNAPLSGATFKVYEANNDGTAPADKNKPLKFTGTKGEYIISTTGAGEDTLEVSDANDNTKGQLVIKGLDDKKYVLEEISAPAGYGKLSGYVQLNLAASYDEYKVDESQPSLIVRTGTDSNLSAMENENSNTILIKNKAGSSLVGTGGIGTTIFYIVGGALMAGAVVLLIVRKRINNK